MLPWVLVEKYTYKTSLKADKEIGGGGVCAAHHESKWRDGRLEKHPKSITQTHLTRYARSCLRSVGKTKALRNSRILLQSQRLTPFKISRRRETHPLSKIRSLEEIIIRTYRLKTDLSNE